MILPIDSLFEFNTCVALHASMVVGMVVIQFSTIQDRTSREEEQANPSFMGPTIISRERVCVPWSHTAEQDVYTLHSPIKHAQE